LGATHDLGQLLYLRFLYWVIAVALTALGGSWASRFVLSKRSRIARSLDKHVPDAVGFEEAALLLIAIYLPAVLLTLLLRFCGVRGQS
jgi:hypothetical protein